MVKIIMQKRINPVIHKGFLRKISPKIKRGREAAPHRIRSIIIIAISLCFLFFLLRSVYLPYHGSGQGKKNNARF